MIRLINGCLICMLAVSCHQSRSDWELLKEHKLEQVRPIGIAVLQNKLWVSDGDHNRLLQIDTDGTILDQVSNFERPMHIATSKDILLIPEYGKDQITTYANGKLDQLTNLPELDAPAGVFKFNNELAIADFYNNAVHFFNGKNWIKIGKKGTDLGQFNYPTDVHINANYIYVADAYNHRVQVFDKSGGFVKVLGENLGINAATGIHVTDQEIFITDFENSRLFVVSHENELLQKITDGVEKPTDMLVFNNQLYVVNYKSGTLSVFRR
ncbi:hypothetical protein [Aquimarina agarivorans]|uniref:hypothetical protein n=1 Tax=Aquimarina agarivorans TaxID=980584 RepID=UPI000248E689|nr:hypothetical protein [Aquimarina agarivorans]